MGLRFLSYRSKYFTEPLVGLVSGVDDSLVSPCIAAGNLVTNLYDLIEDWESVSHAIFPGEPRELVEDVEVLAPLVGRDVLAVAKNYRDHVKEMRLAGAQAPPAEMELPMMFTKRATSIIPSGGKIYLHPHATHSVDYEGELGIIIGKAGMSIKKEDAFKHIWGATIINDVSARDRQKKHKQFYVGKSFDTFCPIGPFAVHTSEIDWTKLILETRVNGEVRQHQNTSDVIFDIPTLMETCSVGITLQPGDIIATGTPAGVAAGRNPSPWLKDGDIVEVSITGLGTLRNTVEAASAPPPACSQLRTRTSSLAPPPHRLALASGKYLNVDVTIPPSIVNPPTLVFVHGLGGSMSNYFALVQAAGVRTTHRVVLFDLEGHGKSPLSTPTSRLTIEAFAEDIRFLLHALHVSGSITLVAHSMGGLIASHFAARYPERVEKLFLMGPAGPTTPTATEALVARAAKVQSEGLSSVVGLIAGAGLSRHTKRNSPLIDAIVRTSVLSSPVEGYVRTTLALATATNAPAYNQITAKTLIVIGSDDKMTPRAQAADVIQANVPGAEIKVLKNVAHWPQLEALDETAQILKSYVVGRDLVSARL